MNFVERKKFRLKNVAESLNVIILIVPNQFSQLKLQ